MHEWLSNISLLVEEYQKISQFSGRIESNKNVGEKQGNLFTNLRLFGRGCFLNHARQNMPIIS